MANGKKAGDVLAKADFRLTGTGWNDMVVDETVHAELYVSGAFQYGNQTGMSLEWNARKGWNRLETYDTRYSDVTVENFTQFAKEVLEGQVMKSIKVEVI